MVPGWFCTPTTATISPSRTERRVTTPSIGAVISVFARLSRTRESWARPWATRRVAASTAAWAESAAAAIAWSSSACDWIQAHQGARSLERLARFDLARRGSLVGAEGGEQCSGGLLVARRRHRVEARQHLAGAHRVALLDEQLHQLAHGARADVGVARGDDLAGGGDVGAAEDRLAHHLLDVDLDRAGPAVAEESGGGGGSDDEQKDKTPAGATHQGRRPSTPRVLTFGAMATGVITERGSRQFWEAIGQAARAGQAKRPPAALDARRRGSGRGGGDARPRAHLGRRPGALCRAQRGPRLRQRHLRPGADCLAGADQPPRARAQAAAQPGHRPLRRALPRGLRRLAGDLRGDRPARRRRRRRAAQGGERRGLRDAVDAAGDPRPGGRRGALLRPRRGERRGAQVAVLGREIADKTSRPRTRSARRCALPERGFTVVGVQARLGTSGGFSLDRLRLDPLTAFERPTGRRRRCRCRDGRRRRRGWQRGGAAQAEDRARATMRARRQLAPGEEDNFDVLSPEAARTFVFTLAKRIGGAAPLLGAMALLAAIVVVANTTLVSVAQRTLRSACGERSVRRGARSSPRCSPSRRSSRSSRACRDGRRGAHRPGARRRARLPARRVAAHRSSWRSPTRWPPGSSPATTRRGAPRASTRSRPCGWRSRAAASAAGGRWRSSRAAWPRRGSARSRCVRRSR